MSAIRAYIQNYRQRQHVRPFALAAPILILLLALPLLRPLRHPAVSAEEAATLTAVQSMVEHNTTAPLTADPRIDRPVYVFLLAGPYWLMYHAGLTFHHNPILVCYLLTILGVTLPAAFSAGLVYRMGRMFELKRPWRMGLAFACVMASGLFAYATVLNAQAPAAFALLWSCACLTHVIAVVGGHPAKSGPWLAVAGLLAAAATVIEPASLPFLLGFPLVILALRWTWSLRIAGVLIYALGTLPPLALHVVLVAPTDPVHHVETVLIDSRQYLLHPAQAVTATPAAPSAAADPLALDDDDAASRGPLSTAVSSLTDALLGPHGLLSHFPILLLPAFGIAAVMHRHWPTPTKMLAAVTAAASLAILLASAAGLTTTAAGGGGGPTPSDLAFASRPFIVFAPLLLFWCGAWLRRSHRPGTWSLVGTLLGFSVIVSLLGATNPLPPSGYHDYTPLAALRTLLHPTPTGDPTDQAKAVTTISAESHPEN